MAQFRRDAVHAWRSFSARPAATLGTLAVLAIGIGLSAAIFALADPFLWKPLPYGAPDRLVIIRVNATRRGPGVPGQHKTPTLQEWRAHRELFVDVAGSVGFEDLRLRTGTGVARLGVVKVSTNFFDVLGVRIRAANTWHAQEVGEPRWIAPLASGRTRLTAAGVLGSSFLVTPDGDAVQVSDILPREFVFPAEDRFQQINAVTPAELDDILVSEGTRTWSVACIARLQPGVREEQIRTTLSKELLPNDLAVDVQSLSAYLTGRYHPLALGALAAGLLITAICAANIVNLTLAQRIYRTREFATREALGASRRDLASLMITETFFVTVVGLVGGLVLAQLSILAIARIVPADYALLGAPAMNGRVVALATALGFAIVVMSVPVAWLAWRTTLTAVIARALSIDGRRLRWVRWVMTAGQSTIAMLLLFCGVLFVRSYVELWQQDTGFSGPVLAMSAIYPRGTDGDRAMQDIRATIESLQVLPGVDSAAASTADFLNDPTIMGGVLGGARLSMGDHQFMLPPKDVTPTFFQTIGGSLIAGRFFSDRDVGWDAVIVDDELTRRIWPRVPPAFAVGTTFTVNGSTTGTIVGVVRGVRDRGLDKPLTGSIYRPLQATSRDTVHYVLRLASESVMLGDQPRSTAQRINPDVVVLPAMPLNTRAAESIKGRTLSALVMALFTVAGLGVTASGLFGVSAFVVARRTREIAIRVSIGARRWQVGWLVLKEAAFTHGVGCGVGILIGRNISRAVESQLYGIQATDLTSTILAAAVMVLVGAAAAWIPGRRALRIHPAVALRVE